MKILFVRSIPTKISTKWGNKFWWLTPALPPLHIGAGSLTLSLQPDASRAIVDLWDDLSAAAARALLALAGEAATEYGITGWPEGAAIEAAAVGFKSWRSTRGKGNDERRQILERLAGFLERHGDSRFSDWAADGSMVRDRAGWWKPDDQGGRLYLFTADGLREALKGFDFNRALDVLEQAGAIPKANTRGERAKPETIGGRKVRVYQVRADALQQSHPRSP